MNGKKVIVPNRGVIALDIIDSLKSLGLETILLHSPEDANTLPVKIADRSYKFYSSKLENSYLDRESILEKALELKADYIHPGYGFISEDPEFARLCRENGVTLLSPSEEILALTGDKLSLRRMAEESGIPVIPHSPLIKSTEDLDPLLPRLSFPQLVKPLKGYGGKGIKQVGNREEARNSIREALKRMANKKEGLFLEPYFGNGRHIEIPFFRDTKGNILILPEIESSVQRRFQKIFQESPSPAINAKKREELNNYTQILANKLNYIGMGYLEFILKGERLLFNEINPTIQINTLIPEIHIVSNFIKKQFAITNHQALHHVSGTKVITPRHHIALVSLMAENPYNLFRPSSGTITDFYNYSTIRNIFKTSIHSGESVSPLYSPFIGKILSFSGKRETTLSNLRCFLDNIYIRGIHTNLIFLKQMLENTSLQNGKIGIDFLHSSYDFLKHDPQRKDLEIATALLAASFHIDNQKKNYRNDRSHMKQPNIIQRILGM